MAKYTIHAGKHYHGVPPFSTLPWVGKQSMARYVTFDASCAYDSAPYNADDVNKLFGLSFGFGGVHKDSARFGWRYSMADQCIELLAYCYVAGQRNWDEQLRFPVVAQVRLGERVQCSIKAHSSNGEGSYFFDVDRSGEIYTHEVTVSAPATLPSYGLTHGPYFGGELTAPHTMAIQVDRK